MTKKERLPIPLDSVDPDDWEVYRDWCLEQKCPQSHADLLWRIVEGLRLKPRLVLLAGWRGSGMVPVVPHTPALEKIEFDALLLPSWREANGDQVTWTGVPSDYPCLIEFFPHVAWDFFVKVAV
jgi:hypothetical protein